MNTINYINIETANAPKEIKSVEIIKDSKVDSMYSYDDLMSALNSFRALSGVRVKVWQREKMRDSAYEILSNFIKKTYNK